jgi:5-methyltetrahydrofolate--homocysteine methyltransferase
VDWDLVVEGYREQAGALLAGGVDLLLLETVFDTLMVKAALAACDDAMAAAGRRVPLMVSGTITDASGRTLSGQTLEAFWTSIAHADLLAVGLNCALGPKELRPYVAELSRLAPVFTVAYPNAGLPNAFGGYDEGPEEMTAVLREFVREGWVNVLGGCCGTTPDHVRAFAAAVRDVPPRVPPPVDPTRGSPASSRSSSGPTPTSSTSASAPTSRVPAASRASCGRATWRRRSRSRATR